MKNMKKIIAVLLVLAALASLLLRAAQSRLSPAQRPQIPASLLPRQQTRQRRLWNL